MLDLFRSPPPPPLPPPPAAIHAFTRAIGIEARNHQTRYMSNGAMLKIEAIVILP